MKKYLILNWFEKKIKSAYLIDIWENVCGPIWQVFDLTETLGLLVWHVFDLTETIFLSI